MLSMETLTPLGQKNLYGYSAFDMLNFQNRQKQTTVTGLLSGMQASSSSIFSPVAPDLMYQIYDAKALTPAIMQNYLKKVDDTFAPPVQETIPQNNDYATIVDELLEEGKTTGETSEQQPDLETAASPALEDQAKPATSDHFGIVGEVFDKYA